MLTCQKREVAAASQVVTGRVSNDYHRHYLSIEVLKYIIYACKFVQVLSGMSFNYIVANRLVSLSIYIFQYMKFFASELFSLTKF